MKICLIGVLISASSNVFAFSFVPEKTEWNIWGPYCKARFAANTNSRLVDFRINVSKHEIEKWEKTIGGVFHHLHHYCAGVIWLNRSYAVLNKKYSKQFCLKSAINEMTYTFSKVDSSNTLFVIMSGKLAEAYDRAGETARAATILSTMLEKKPNDPKAYVVYSKHYMRKGDLGVAEESLKDGEKKIANSAIIQYQLAKLYLKKKDYEQSKKYAQLAEKGGHGVSSLKRKLKKAGHPL
jgi:tetratricopeptide (TPR) repeat protein